MTWAEHLKRVFHNDVETCSACNGAVNVFASIDGSMAIKKILTHLGEKAASLEPIQLPKSRASPQ